MRTASLWLNFEDFGGINPKTSVFPPDQSQSFTNQSATLKDNRGSLDWRNSFLCQFSPWWSQPPKRVRQRQQKYPDIQAKAQEKAREGILTRDLSEPCCHAIIFSWSRPSTLALDWLLSSIELFLIWLILSCTKFELKRFSKAPDDKIHVVRIFSSFHVSSFFVFQQRRR